MKCPTQHIQLPPVLFICLFFFSACTSLTPRVSEKSKDLHVPSEAKAIISILKNQNHKLKTFKGLGKITILGKEEKEMTTRIAWIASAPDRMRITLNSASGQPVVSAASDGQWFYLVSHTDGDFYKKRATNSNMKRFFSISIKSEDIVNILAGRVPVEKYDSAALLGNRSIKGLPGNGFKGPSPSSPNGGIEGNENGYVLVLKNKWGDIREKIYLDGNKKDVHKIEIFDFTGVLVYRVEFDRMQEIKAYRVPSRLKVSNDDGAGFRLDLDRYWADATVSSSIFTLTPPK